MTFCVPVLEGNILPFNPAQLTEGFNEASFDSGATLPSCRACAEISNGG